MEKEKSVYCSTMWNAGKHCSLISVMCSELWILYTTVKERVEVFNMKFNKGSGSECMDGIRGLACKRKI